MRRLALLAALLLVPFSLAGVPAAVASLREDQQVDGGWGSRADTDWVLLGLAAAGEDARAWDVETYLAAHPPDATSLLAWERSTLALACAGLDASQYALVVQLGYVAGQFGSPTTLNDDFWGILSLRAAGVPADDARLRSSAAFVLAGQHVDGGWGWAVAGASDPDDTGAALMALASDDAPGRDVAVARALAYLRAAQNADAGWGFVAGAPSNALSTAWTTMGLLASDEPAPVEYLLSLQREDGRFPYAAGQVATPAITATALMPLAGASYDCRP